MATATIAALRPIRLGSAARSGWLATVSVGVSAVVGTASFAVLLTLVSIGVPLLILALAGLPLLWLAFHVAHAVAVVERARIEAYTGDPIPIRPALRTEGGPPRRLWQRLTAVQTWAELGYALVALPLASWFFATVVYAAWGGGVAFVLFPAYGWSLLGHGHPIGMDIGYGLSCLFYVGIGVPLLVAAPLLARGADVLQVRMARFFLSPSDREVLESRVESLQDTRSRMVAAADAERRRIERDLHDGAQQRLVALAMTLGRARNRMDNDPEAARLLVDEAHGEAKLALTELRDLARGIHPAVLTDRGLDAALSALAARSPVPVAVDVALTERPVPATEAVAYFVAAEALANIGKHAAASRASVSVHSGHGRLVMEIGDDGVGGADPTRGSGLAGLRDRVLAIDGTFTLDSPVGGPTTMRVELPCGS